MSLYDEICDVQKEVTDKRNEYIKACENEAVTFFEWFQSPAQWGRPVQFAEKNSNKWDKSPIGRLRPTGNGNQLAVQVRLEWTGNGLDTMFSIRKSGSEIEVNFLGFKSTLIPPENIYQIQTLKTALAQKYSQILINRINEDSLAFN